MEDTWLVLATTSWVGWRIPDCNVLCMSFFKDPLPPETVFDLCLHIVKRKRDQERCKKSEKKDAAVRWRSCWRGRLADLGGPVRHGNALSHNNLCIAWGPVRQSAKVPAF